MAKKQRLTERLNIALAQASAAVAIGRDNSERAQVACRQGGNALDDAQKIMSEIMRAPPKRSNLSGEPGKPETSRR